MKEMRSGERPLLGILLLAGVLATWALPPSTAFGDPVPSAAPPTKPEKLAPVQASGPTATERETLQKIHDANQVEIEMGELAKQKGSTKAVREFGRRLIADHTLAEKKIDRYLRMRGSDIRTLATTATDSEHAVIGTKSGPEFDRAFAMQMISDHTKVIELVEGARKETGDDDLRAFYDELLPTLQAHKRTAQDIVAASART
jgi:putative membrane protein